MVDVVHSEEEVMNLRLGRSQRLLLEGASLGHLLLNLSLPLLVLGEGEGKGEGGGDRERRTGVLR